MKESDLRVRLFCFIYVCCNLRSNRGESWWFYPTRPIHRLIDGVWISLG